LILAVSRKHIGAEPGRSGKSLQALPSGHVPAPASWRVSGYGNAKDRFFQSMGKSHLAQHASFDPLDAIESLRLREIFCVFGPLKETSPPAGIRSTGQGSLPRFNLF
jgi:hypothetical protein